MKNLWLIENNDEAVKRFQAAVGSMFHVYTWCWPIGLPDSIEKIKANQEHRLAAIVLSPDHTVGSFRWLKRIQHAVAELKKYAPTGTEIFLWTKFAGSFQENQHFMEELKMMSCSVVDKLDFNEEENILKLLKPLA